MAELDPTLLARFWSKVDRRGTDECWPWTGGSFSGRGGYGVLASGRLKVRAHRLSWAIVNGGVLPPLGMDICHHCDNPPCCNPRHLFLGTRSENMIDAARKGRLLLRGRPEKITHCKRSGHPFSPENTRTSPNGTNRYCRACERAREAARRQV